MTVGSRCEGVDLLEQPDRKKNEQSEKMDENKEHSRGSDASEINKKREKKTRSVRILVLAWWSVEVLEM